MQPVAATVARTQQGFVEGRNILENAVELDGVARIAGMAASFAQVPVEEEDEHGDSTGPRLDRPAAELLGGTFLLTRAMSPRSIALEEIGLRARGVYLAARGRGNHSTGPTLCFFYFLQSALFDFAVGHARCASSCREVRRG